MIYAIANQKGGVGKTTTAAAIVTGAKLRGRRALAVDLDPQGNLTNTMRGDPAARGVFELLTGTASALDVIQEREQADIIPAGPSLSAADTVLTRRDRTNALKNGLRKVKSLYDIIVIDTPPALGTLFLNALNAADRVIIPTAASVYALQGLSLLIQTIRETQHEYNKQLSVAGVLFVMHNTRTNAARTYTQIIEEQAKKWRVPVFRARIRRGVAVEESQIFRESIFTHAPKSNPARDYMELLDELKI